MSALHASSPHGSAGALLLPALKGFVTASCLIVAGSMTATSLQFLPGLIGIAQHSVERSASSRVESGRLTPNPEPSNPAPETKSIHLTVPDASNWPAQKLNASVAGHKIAARQFSLMSKSAFLSQVPFELLSIISSGYLAYYYRRHITLSPHIWKSWAAVAGLITIVFPYTGIMMVPYDHKIARIAGFEEKLESYEDAPPDHDAEKTNTVEFLTKWNSLNGVRAVIMTLAGSLGLYTLLV
ncbi:Hypothetical protein R9X50_00013700 [Acrodontium crateriforme]|uniref:DUF1772-domain-containing protein n=1 Tax=Acrodontium crateriforme TaxID=150365 RepID=A0AAQ3LX89_9PEZI|nr:Hypothetical protein R9X50_00013700 [Acrodontium crateriforme]